MFAFVLVLLVITACGLQAAEIKCEKIDHFEKSEKCCYLDLSTNVSSRDVIISETETSEIDAILFNYNRRIQYLPIRVHKIFPNLEFYLARNAAVKQVSALNFEKLTNLKVINLRANQISFVPNHCFDGLIKLNEIYLRENQITTINGYAFINLPQLVLVDLRSNICIDKIFETESSLNTFRRRINRNCAADEAAIKKLTCSESLVCVEGVDELFVSNDERIPTCCKLDFGVQVDSPDYTFVNDTNYASLETLHIIHQRNMDFLPVEVYERFPRLRFYWVLDTPIQKIFKKNFEKLFQLEQLQLKSNQIEMIKSDTFEDLKSLKEIHIWNQRLTALNGLAFQREKLPQLKDIHLHNNDCIDKWFSDGEVNTTAPAIISSSCGFDEFVSIEVSCENYKDYELFHDLSLYTSVDSCFMNEKTVINSTNFVVADLRDVDVEGMIFEGNSNIEYLPSRLFLQFPNLLIYKAAECSVNEINKENFEELTRLKVIDLSFNRIRKISGNTFLELESLLLVNLKNNQISSMNGRTFHKLPLLTSLDLRSNECIDDQLEEGETLDNFTNKIIQKCAFTETGDREFLKVFDINCGVGMKGSGFIIHGNSTVRGQWPFMAALFSKPNDTFFCGGNVITTSHVLTAAHCIHNKNDAKPRQMDRIVVYLGRHDFTQVEIGSKIRGVKNFIVHESWNTGSDQYGYDLAVLEMNQKVDFSELIQPICLTIEPELSQKEAGVVGKKNLVNNKTIVQQVGWGKSESVAGHENVLRQILITSVTVADCFQKDFRLGSIFSKGMYCAGGNGAGPCHGDSGGGFYVKYHGLWTLRGVVSAGKLNREGGCDVGRFTLFTNVLDFTTWINDVVRNLTILSRTEGSGI